MRAHENSCSHTAQAQSTPPSFGEILKGGGVFVFAYGGEKMKIDGRGHSQYNERIGICTNFGGSMFAVNYTGLRENMKMYLERVTDDYEPMMVTRKNNKNVVVLSEGAYNNLMENVYLLGNKANYDWLMESKRQLEAGDAHAHKLADD